MLIKSELREVLNVVLSEELPDQTGKERGIVVDALLDRIEAELFEVFDDETEDDSEIDFENADD